MNKIIIAIMIIIIATIAFNTPKPQGRVPEYVERIHRNEK